MTTLETGAREDPEADLASCFAAGRTHPAEASPDLLARVLADGLDRQPAMARVTGRAAGQKAQPGGWRFVLACLGGWGAVSGLGVASIAGLWLGISPPGQMAILTDGVLGLATTNAAVEVDQIELLPNFETLLTEG